MTEPAGKLTQETPVVRLAAGRHKRAASGHPWIFSNEIEMTAAVKSLTPGEPVTFETASGETLGAGFFNPHSLIAGRIVRRDAGPIDGALLEDRLAKALALRDRLFDAPFYRLVHAEADGLPGLIVDRYGDVLVVQPNAAGMERLTDELLAALRTTLQPAAVLLKADAPARQQEGLDSYVRWDGPEPDAPLKVIEGGVEFLVDPAGGQKTGWFFDQAANRALVARFATGARVLDVYCYLGGFALQTAAAGADAVTGIDRSEAALDLAARSAALNGLGARCSFRRGAAFDEMEALTTAGERFDIVVVDPPAFVKSRKDLKPGLRGYRKMVRLAAPLVAPGGFLFAASCSHHVAPDAFAEQLRRGLADAGRGGRILHAGGAGPDHPVHPFLPESAYLKFQFLQLD